MKQKITKLFVSFLSVILILPQLLQADFVYTNIPAAINPLFATVSQSYLNDGKDIFVLIQDLHSNPEVQTNIYKTIDFFDKNYGINKILIEGAPSAKIDTSFIKSLNNYDPKVSDYLLNKGMLTGAEYFLIKNNSAVPVYGLEDWETYINNIRLLASINNNLKGSQKVFNEFYNTVIERTKSKKLMKYVDFDINDTKINKKVNLPILKYDTLNNFIFLSDTKKNLNKKNINKEHSKFVGELKSSLGYDKFKDIIDKSKNNDLTEYWQQLYKQFSQNQSYQSQYKNLFSYLNYVLKINSLNMVSLIHQQNEYFNDFLNDLYTKDKDTEEKIFILKMTSLFEKIITLSISEYEYDFFTSNFERYKELLNFYLTNEDLIKFDAIIEVNKFLEYYDVNKKRNNIFINNILSSQTVKGNNSNSDKKINIIITGGFHSSILNDLKKNNLQYLLVTPYTKNSTVTDAFSKIISSAYEQQTIIQIQMLLATSPLIPEHTKDLFLAELTAAFAEVYDQDPKIVEEHIRKLVRGKWSEPLNIHIKDDNFNIFIGNQVISFKIKNNKLDFTDYKIGPIEEDTIFIRDYTKKKTVEYLATVGSETFVFEIDEDIAANLTQEDITEIIEEIVVRIPEEEEIVSFSQRDAEDKKSYPIRIAIKTFEKSNSTDLFINNIDETKTFFINKSLLKADPSARTLFLKISLIHAILFSFFNADAFDKDLLTNDDINFIFINVRKDEFGLPDIQSLKESLKKATETEFSDKEIRVFSQLKKYSGNLELLIQEVLQKDYISEYRLPHWKHIISQYFAPNKGESKKAARRRKHLEKEFFSKMIVDNSQEESFQEFLDRRVSKERQNKINANIEFLAQYLIDSVSEQEKQYAQQMSADLEQNIQDCLRLMYLKLPKHTFEKFLNEKGVVADHNFNHSMNLIKNAIDIIKTEGKPFAEIDFTIVVYAALMHDVACTFFRDNHEKNSAILATEMLRSSSLPTRTRKRIVAACIGHEKVGDRGERVEHQIYEARLIHDADGLSAVMDLARIINIWIKNKEPFFFKERTVAERLDLIERDRFLYTEGGDMINDLLRQFVRMKPSRYLTKGAQTILQKAMKNGQSYLTDLLNENKQRIIETYNLTEEDFQQAIETISIMFRNKDYQEILQRTPTKKELKNEAHDEIFDTKKDINTDNTLLIDIVDTKDELYRLEKAERAGVNTLAVSFAGNEILSNIPLTNVITLEKETLTIDGESYDVSINLNLIKLKPAYYSEYMKVLTIDAPELPEELRSEIIKHIRKQLLKNKVYLEYINPLENMAIINFESANGNYDKLMASKALNFNFASILVDAWGDVPVLYDLRKEKSLISDSQEIINPRKINAMLSAS